MNLIEGIVKELNRNRELVKEYRAIGLPGMFGAMMIEKDIKDAEKCLTEDDTIEMIKCYERLKENKD